MTFPAGPFLSRAINYVLHSSGRQGILTKLSEHNSPQIPIIAVKSCSNCFLKSKMRRADAQLSRAQEGDPINLFSSGNQACRNQNTPFLCFSGVQRVHPGTAVQPSAESRDPSLLGAPLESRAHEE